MIIKQTLGKLKVEDFRSHHRTFTSDEGMEASGSHCSSVTFLPAGPPQHIPAHPSLHGGGSGRSSRKRGEGGREGPGKVHLLQIITPSFYQLTVNFLPIQTLHLKCKCILERSSLWAIQKRMQYFRGITLITQKASHSIEKGLWEL